jgi:hypothetical protein
VGQVAGGGGRLGDAGHGGQEAGREFLEQAPDREIEGIDVHRHAAARHQDVGAGKAAALAQRHGRAFVQHVRRRQLAPAHAGVGEQGADAAFDVDPAVGAGGAGQVRDLVQLFLALHQVQARAFRRWARFWKSRRISAHAGLAGVGDGFVEVDPVGVGVVDELVVQGAVQGLVGFVADPAVGDQALQGCWGVHVVSYF